MPSWPLLFFVWVFFTGLLSGDSALVDGDTYMHIGIGDWILAHAAVPRVDYFSHTMTGHPWVAHEWMSEVVLALAHQYAGWTGLVVLTGLCSGFAVAYTLRFVLDRHVVPLYAVAFAVLTFMALKTHMLARPHMLTWPIIVLWVGGLLRASEAKRAPPFWLGLLLVPWVNLHGGFVLAFALLPLVAIDGVTAAAKSDRHKLIWDWVFFGAVSAGLTMINPFGYKAWLFISDLLDNSYLKHVSEWQAVDFSKYGSIEVWLYSLLGMGLLGMLRLPLWRTLLLICLMYEALSHVRYVSIFGLVVPMLIALPFARSYANWRSGSGHKEIEPSSLDCAFFRLSRPAGRLGWPLVFLVGLLVAVSNYQRDANQPEESTMPQIGVDAALAAGVQGKVFNHDGAGGYLIMRGIQAYTDGRADLYGSNFMSEINVLLESRDPYQIQYWMDRTEIGWVLLPAAFNLTQTMMKMPLWEKVHDASSVVVFKRSN